MPEASRVRGPFGAVSARCRVRGWADRRDQLLDLPRRQQRQQRRDPRLGQCPPARRQQRRDLLVREPPADLAAGIAGDDRIGRDILRHHGTGTDDRTVAAAFNHKVNPLGVKINAIWSSDIGHWDVPDLTEPLAESWDLVEQGVISAADFKAFTFGNPYKFYTEANPRFFEGTDIAALTPRKS